MKKRLDKNQRRIVIAITLVVCLFACGTLGFRILASSGEESVSWLKCVYMTVISLTTVGYDESIPISDSPARMVFTCVLLLVGITVLSYTFGAIAAFFIEGALTDVFWRRKMKNSLSKLTDHYIVCGAGETSLTAIRELCCTGRSVVVVDSCQELAKHIHEEFGICIVVGDASDDAVLEEAGIRRAHGLLACLPTDKDNLFLVITANQLNEKVRIVSKVTDPANEPKFLKAGACALASPQVIGGLRLVSEMVRPSVVSFLDLMLRDKSSDVRIEEVTMGEANRHAGESLQDLEFRKKYQLQVLAMRKDGEERFIYNPDPGESIPVGATLVILGSAKQVQELRGVLA